MNKSNIHSKNIVGNLASRLAAYSGMAAAFVAFSPDANAQCEAVSVMPDMPGNFENGTVTQIDFDGDGVVDFAVGAYNVLSNSSTQLCIETGPFPLGTASYYVGATCGTLPLSYSVKQFYTQLGTFAFNSVYLEPYNNLAITVPVGTSGSVCAGAGVATSCGLYGLYSSYANSVAFANIMTVADIFEAGTTMPCFFTTSQLGSNPGPLGPYMDTNFPSNPGAGNFAAGQNHFIGVEFTAGDGNTYPGWIEVMISDAGTISVVNTGYNPTVGACIEVGSCETMAACINDLGLEASPCDNAGTTGDFDTANDDTFSLTINPVGDNTTGDYTVSGDITANGTYGSPLIIMGVPANGATFTITVTSNDNPTCTLTQEITAPDACSANPQDVPTVSEWGLIILALLMSITGVVGIRSSKGEEAHEYS